MNPDQPDLSIITNPSKNDSFSHRLISLPSKLNAASELTSFGLIGRLIASKAVNKNKVRAILSKAWKTPNGISINDISSNLFLFRFLSEVDRQKILNLGPWFVEGFLLVLKPCDPLIPLCNIDFTWSPFWVQVRNLPPDKMFQENAETIGNKLGKLIEIEYPKNGNLCWNSFLRIKVHIDTQERFLCGFYLDYSPNPDIWISFKHEKLQDFCYGCGRLAHSKSVCSGPIDPKDLSHKFHHGPRGFGPWVKASIFGLRPLTWLDFLKDEVKTASTSPPPSLAPISLVSSSSLGIPQTLISDTSHDPSNIPNTPNTPHHSVLDLTPPSATNPNIPSSSSSCIPLPTNSQSQISSSPSLISPLETNQILTTYPPTPPWSPLTSLNPWAFLIWPT